ncbi:uncharacterized protein LOC124456587 [Xenia sp. Carnegie-2017]|uniref:uncharacterized protein LOC124456587 n=1 Tax=Xenia sp. Carnegie-2017 TaxID=2897299 RepID=UPI001F04099E|nr:uncharacterized protein LOC124456587 [Xenia sp. Carnegie-2017]
MEWIMKSLKNFKSDSLPVTPIQCPNALTATTSTPKDWLRNYKIPNRYSYAVEAGLKTEYLPPNLINELIRDVCTSVLRFTSYPSKTERVKIALMIVESYPFLKDPLLDANSKPWGSIEMKIYNRFKKLQRKRSNTPVTNVLQTKGKTTKKRNSHCWTNVPEPCESEELTAVITCLGRSQKNSGSC